MKPMRYLLIFSVAMLFITSAYAERGCFYCHENAINKSRHIPSIQEKFGRPFNGHSEKECTECHLTHFEESQSPFMLIKSFPAAKNATYESTSESNTYALCFTCHTEGMLTKNMDNQTDFYTVKKYFGKKKKVNLHWVHVTQTKNGDMPNTGYSCSVCHDVHGSNQAFNIRTDALKGHTPLKFKKTKNGGTCAGSCHSNAEYERN